MKNKAAFSSVSFIIPTYNAARYLAECLSSIDRLDYPKDLIEVIIADGISSDTTIQIANSFKSHIIINKKRIAEYGKYIAFKQSHGEYIVFLDSDNIISSPQWLRSMLMPFEHENIIGVESEYLIASNFTSLNTYSNLLIIVDPLARMLANKPTAIHSYSKGYLEKVYSSGSIIVSGANGFIWRRNIIERYMDNTGELNEVGLLGTLSRTNEVRIASVPGIGIFHYYCETLNDYISKRKKIAFKHLERSKSGETWVSRRGRIRLVLSVIFLVSVIGPTLEAIFNYRKTGRRSWAWHPIISLLTVIIYGQSFLKFKFKQFI